MDGNLVDKEKNLKKYKETEMQFIDMIKSIIEYSEGYWSYVCGNPLKVNNSALFWQNTYRRCFYGH